MSATKESVTTILAEIAAYGEFLPGSVRKTHDKRTLANGKQKVYEAQPIYTYSDLGTGRQVSKRIPKDAFDRVKGLTRRYKGFKKLVARLMRAVIAENLGGDSKKNSSR